MANGSTAHDGGAIDTAGIKDAGLPALQLPDFPSVATVEALQAFQDDHDQRFHVDVMGWTRNKQIAHCALHLAKLAGLFSTIAEKAHHGEMQDDDAVARERIPDILVFALKLANLYGMDLEQGYHARIRETEMKRLR